MKWDGVVSQAQSIFLLLVRLYWGWQFAVVGWGKLTNLARVTEYFASLGLPAPGVQAALVGATEFAGGILLALGFAGRWAALVLACDMIGAYLIAERQALSQIFSDPGKFAAADPFAFLMASLIVALFGPGRYAIDARIRRARTLSPNSED